MWNPFVFTLMGVYGRVHEGAVASSKVQDSFEIFLNIILRVLIILYYRLNNMRFLTFRMLSRAAFLAVVLASPGLPDSVVSDSAAIRDSIVLIFNHSIELCSQSDSLYSAGAMQERNEVQREVRAFDWDWLLPAMSRCQVILARHDDTALAVCLLELVYANRQSASESFTWALGSTYLKNPGIIEAGYVKFDAEAQDDLKRRIWEGLEYLEWDALHPPENHEADEKLTTPAEVAAVQMRFERFLETVREFRSPGGGTQKKPD